MSQHSIAILQCIYCRFHKIHRARGSQFTVEHVLHRALARFQGNLTLNGLVCGECNTYFGNTIDRELTRGTLEAVERFKTGLKALTEFTDFMELHIKFAAESADPKINGAPIRLAVHGQEIEGEFKPQLVLETATGWVHVTIQDLVHGNLPEKGLLMNNWCILANNSREEDEVKALARGWGFSIEQSEDMPPLGMVPIRATYTIGAIIKRAIAKIAFNYFTYHSQRLHRSWPLEAQFDEVRDFVRCGTFPGYEIVVPNENAILMFDTKRLRHTNGHLVTVEMFRTNGVDQIRGQVSLFNNLTWDVLLSRQHHGLQLPLHHGNHWNIHNRICSPLSGLRPGGLLHF